MFPYSIPWMWVYSVVLQKQKKKFLFAKKNVPNLVLQVRISGTEVKFLPASLLSGSDDMGISWDVVMLFCPPIVLSLESSFTDSDSLRSSVKIVFFFS